MHFKIIFKICWRGELSVVSDKCPYGFKINALTASYPKIDRQNVYRIIMIINRIISSTLAFLKLYNACWVKWGVENTWTNNQCHCLTDLRHGWFSDFENNRNLHPHSLNWNFQCSGGQIYLVFCLCVEYLVPHWFADFQAHWIGILYVNEVPKWQK